jgi:hypothetical protein
LVAGEPRQACPSEGPGRPRRCTPHELAKANVEIADLNAARRGSIILRCRVCGEAWTPKAGRGGRLPRRYWVCANGCSGTDAAPEALRRSRRRVWWLRKGHSGSSPEASRARERWKENRSDEYGV